MLQVVYQIVTMCTSCCWWCSCRQEHLIQVWSCWRASKHVESLLCLSDCFKHWGVMFQRRDMHRGETSIPSLPAKVLTLEWWIRWIGYFWSREFFWTSESLLSPSLLTKAAPGDTPHGLPMRNTYPRISMQSSLPHAKEEKIPFLVIKPCTSYQHWILLLLKPVPSFPWTPLS